MKKSSATAMAFSQKARPGSSPRYMNTSGIARRLHRCVAGRPRYCYQYSYLEEGESGASLVPPFLADSFRNCRAVHIGVGVLSVGSSSKVPLISISHLIQIAKFRPAFGGLDKGENPPCPMAAWSLEDITFPVNGL